MIRTSIHAVCDLLRGAGGEKRNGVIRLAIESAANCDELIPNDRIPVMDKLFRLSNTFEHDSAIDNWMSRQSGELGSIAKVWFEVMRNCGNDVRELFHDGHPIACVSDAAFAYVNCFTAHVNVGFFRGADLSDPSKLLKGSGKMMRHVKLLPDSDMESEAITKLVYAAYDDIKVRLAEETN